MDPTLEELRKRAQPWIQPISVEAPSGKSAKFEPGYESIVNEVAKLESPGASPVNWDRVVDVGGALLKTTCKDLLIACYVFYGLYATRGLSGLVEGMSALAELLDQYWVALFPEISRPRARLNAISWFLQRTAVTLAGAQNTPVDREIIDALELATQRLVAVTRERFGASGPAFGPLLQTLERMRLSLPAEGTGVAVAPNTLAVAPEAATLAEPPPQDSASAANFLRNVGSSLVTAAGLLRQANTADPLSYRILRTGLWLHLTQMPAPGPNGNIAVPPVPAALMKQLNTMALNGKWEAALEESESALVMNRFSLDLQHFSNQALATLGSSHRAAREALIGEVAGWLKRMPSAPDLLASDGTPLAGPRTKEWIDQEVRPVPTLNSEDPRTQERHGLLAKASQRLDASNPSESIRLFEEHLPLARPGRERFQLRLLLAKFCSGAGQPGLARGLYSSLDEECTRHGLDTWEPELAQECLEGLLRTVRPQPGAPLAPEFMPQYRRLCILSLSAALRIMG